MTQQYTDLERAARVVVRMRDLFLEDAGLYAGVLDAAITELQGAVIDAELQRQDVNRCQCSTSSSGGRSLPVDASERMPANEIRAPVLPADNAYSHVPHRPACLMGLTCSHHLTGINIMKSIIIAAVIILSQSTSVLARDLPPPPYDECRWTTSQSVACQDRFGNVVNCVLRQTEAVIRWSCL